MAKCTEKLKQSDPLTFSIISSKENTIRYLLSFIEDDKDLFDYTNKLLRKKVPKYFYINPSSSSGKYHPPDERCYYGLVLHTLRVVKLTHDICNFKNIAMKKHDRNITVVAAILHDTLKYDIPPGKSHTVDDHPIIACKYLNIPEEIGRIIKSHYGYWFTPEDYQKMDDMQRALYMADAIASKPYISIKISQEIQ